MVEVAVVEMIVVVKLFASLTSRWTGRRRKRCSGEETSTSDGDRCGILFFRLVSLGGVGGC